MNIPEEKLENYRRCLIECSYPNATIMDTKDIEKILFENRINFLHWAITAFNPQYENILEQAKRKQKYEIGLANLISQNACCFESQKTDFLNKKLKPQDDIVIFDRVFKLLSSEFAHVDTENLNAEANLILRELKNPTEDFEATIFVKNKLFEKEIKNLSNEDRQKKIDNFSKENVDLDSQISEVRSELGAVKQQNVLTNNEASTSAADFTLNSNQSQDNLNRTAEKVENLISNFKETFSEYCAHFVKTPERKANEELDSEVKNCNENINYLKKVLVNKNFLKNLKADVDEDKNNILSEYVTNNYKLLEEIMYDEEDGDSTNKSDW